MKLSEYKKKVDAILTKKAGIGIDEIGDEVVKSALENNETPDELVTWFMEKYDIEELEKGVHY